MFYLPTVKFPSAITSKGSLLKLKQLTLLSSANMFSNLFFVRGNVTRERASSLLTHFTCKLSSLVTSSPPRYLQEKSNTRTTMYKERDKRRFNFQIYPGQECLSLNDKSWKEKQGLKTPFSENSF